MLLSAVLFMTCSMLAITQARPNEALTKGISEFSSQLYYECAVSKPGQNLIISPLSVSSALALLSQGAKGNVFEQLKNGLHLPTDKMVAANQFQEYYNSLLKGIGQSTLSIANQIYVQDGYTLKKDFSDVAVEKFSSGVAPLNFKEATISAQTINKFIENKTNDKIKDFIKPDALNENTRMVLVNAIHFKGDWECPFETHSTYKRDFYATETEKHSVDFMSQTSYFNYAELNDLDATALEMKYKESSFSFLIVLPNKRTGLSELETKLKNYDLSTITSQMNNEKAHILIPKFKIEFDIELNEVLEKMGMGAMFSNADLSGIVDSVEGMNVDAVIHKAFIEVNELGSEAAAATGIISFGASPFASWPKNFRADHPFVYFIRETESNTNLFSGRVLRV